MEKFLRIIDAASTWTGKLASFLVVLLILSIGYDITVRYLFAVPNLWAYDSTYMLYGTPCSGPPIAIVWAAMCAWI